MERFVVEERTYYPLGFDPEVSWHVWNVHNFKVGVFYRGDGKWMVSPYREGNEQLSRTGKWLWLPHKMNALKWCRFDFETACRLAEEAVDKRVANGMTWQQYLVWHEQNR